MDSPVLDETVEVATPPQFPGGVPGIWSPEHLFVAAVSSCFMTTFTAIAENSKLDFQSLNINADGVLGKEDGRFMVTQITLKPELVIDDAAYREKAERILQKAEAACLISNSIRSEIILQPQVVIGAPA